MSRTRILQLGEMWPDSDKTPNWPGTSASNRYWIGANPMASSEHSSDGLVVLGRKCDSLEEIERVAAEIRADLEQTLSEARAKLTKDDV